MLYIGKRIRGFMTAVCLRLLGRKINFDPLRLLVSRHASINIRGNGILTTGYLMLGEGSFLEVEGTLSIGAGTYFNRNCNVVSCRAIRIGNGCAFGPNVCIYDHDHAFNEDGQINGEFKCSDVFIGDNVWVGAGVIILRGAHIGNNCIIGAGTVICGEVAPNTLVTTSRSLELKPLRNYLYPATSK